jgi:hypothetical protein
MSGNDFLDKCSALVEGATSAPAGHEGRLAYCAGFFDGIMDSVTMERHGKVDSQNVPIFCEPDTATNGQMFRVVGKWMRDNPSKLHYSANSLIRVALGDSFPCK